MENDMIKINELLQKIKDIPSPEKTSEMNVLSFQAKSRQENVNSDIIAYLLNPEKGHGQGNKFLKLFLDQVKIPQGELSNIGVYREYCTDEYCRIDIVIDSTEWIIGIECKIIDSTGEQENQLDNYYKYIKSLTEKSNRKVYFLYLTKDGKSSDTLSDENKKLLGNDYKEISWSRDILEWLKKCKDSIEKGLKETTLYSALLQYIDFLEELTGQKEEDKTMQIEMVKTMLNQDLSEDQLQDLALSAPIAHQLRYILPLYDKLDKNKYKVSFYYQNEDNEEYTTESDRDKYIKKVLDRLAYWKNILYYHHGIEIKYEDKTILLYMGMQKGNKTLLALSTNHITERVGWIKNDNNNNYFTSESIEKALSEFEEIIKEI